MIVHVRVAVLLAILLSWGGTAHCGGNVAAYGAKVSFHEGHPIRFHDFELTFLGERREYPRVYPRGFLYYDFQAVAGTEEVKVSWSAGTGSIAPVQFEVGGRRFLLELGWSEAAGRLKPNELVVKPWRVEQ